MTGKMRRDSEPDRKERVKERKELEEAVKSLDGPSPVPPQAPPQDGADDEVPDGAQPLK